MKRDQCCNHNCQQGDTCPLRTERPGYDRRQGPTWIWRWFGWLLKDERSGKDRRQK